MATTTAPQKQIGATTNSGISNTAPAVLSTVVIPKPKSIYNDNKDYKDFSGDYNPRIFRDNAKDVFTVEFKDLKGKKGTFHFDLLPAIENRGGGNIRAGDVPEAKPGILRMLETRHKNIVIPGATPVVQSIGIKSALVNLVGSFTGAEGNSAEAKTKDDVLLAAYGDTSHSSNDAYTKATAFHNEVVLPMTQVVVTVQASNGSAGVIKMVYEGVIIKFKDYAVRSNRNYYTIDLLFTKYAAHQVSEVVMSELEKQVEGASKEDKAKAEAADVALKTAEKAYEDAQTALNEAAADSGRADVRPEQTLVKAALKAVEEAKAELAKEIQAAQDNQKVIANDKEEGEGE